MNNELNQWAFTLMALHLMTQGQRSISYKGCAYRGVDGGKCPVGALISDSEYRPEMEGRSVRNLISKFHPPSLAGLDVNMLQAVQRIHDDVPSHEWRIRLTGVAKKYGLSSAVLTEGKLPGE